MSPEESLEALSAEAARFGLAAYRAHLLGALTLEELAALLASQVIEANAKAGTLAALSVSAAVSTLLGTYVAPSAVKSQDSEALTRAAQTLVEALEETRRPEKRITRFMTNEPRDTYTASFGEALEATAKALGATWSADEAREGQFPERKRLVIGWRRLLAPGACELCEWLEKDGYIYPPERKMFHHKGCRCVREVVASREGRVMLNRERKTKPLPRRTDARRTVTEGQRATTLD